MCMTLLRRRSKKLLSNSTTVEMWDAYTPWMPAMGVKLLKVLIEVMERTANYKVALAIQTATADPNAPDAWVVLGSYINATGRHCQGNFDVGTAVDGKFWFRIGAASLNTTGQALESGDVVLTPTMRT